MQYRKLDENGDYMLGGRNHFLSGREAVGQAIKTRLLLLLGEWWEDESDGLPLFEQIFGSFRGRDNLEDIDLLLSERILGTENVTGISQLNSSFDPVRRTYSVSCVADTAFGAIGVQVGEGNLVNVKLEV